jgi:Sec-independent protein translocase protein TatA
MDGLSVGETIIVMLIVLIVFGLTRLPDIGVTLDRVTDATRAAANIVEAEITGAPQLTSPKARDRSVSPLPDDEA